MKLFELECPSCGATIGDTVTANVVMCEYCGSRYVIDGEDVVLPTKSAAQASMLTPISPSELFDFVALECREFLARIGYGGFESSRKILKGLNLDEADDIYLIHDDTMLKSGKNGYAISRRGMHCREMGDPDAHMLNWKEIGSMNRPYIDGCYIRFGETSVCYYTDNNDNLPELLDLYERIHAQAIRVDW